MDEELDPRLDKQALEQLHDYAEAIKVYIIDLWEDGHKPERNFYNVRAYKWDPKRTTIKEQPLHCGLAPEWAYHHTVYSKYYLKHYGLKTKEQRQRKIDRYDKYDPDARFIHEEYYESLHDDHYAELDLEDVKRKLEEQWKNKNKPDIKKTKQDKMEQDTYYEVKRLKDDKKLKVKEENLDEVLARTDSDGNKKFKKIKEVDLERYYSNDSQESDNELVCPFCGKECKSKAGLTNHKKACE